MNAVQREFTRVLRHVGLRVTALQLAVLSAIEGCPPHADADTIAAAVRARSGDISPQTVHNVLRAFAEAGLVRRIEPAGSPGLYELRAGDNHHVVCRRCGATVDIDCVTGAAPCLEPSQAGGFWIDEAEITFWGLCPRCQGEANARQSAVLTQYTKAGLFSKVGKQTPVFARFSTVAGELGSADTKRDPHGFAIKFYTEQGNYTPVFFIRDPQKFSDFIHSQKRHPVTNVQDHNMQWDFWSLSPASRAPGHVPDERPRHAA